MVEERFLAQVSEKAGSHELAEIDPDIVLDGDTPRVIDEWQEVPQIWDRVRRRVDGPEAGRRMYVLTGSSRLSRKHANHSGSGRDADGLEVDAVTELKDGRWGVFVIPLTKLGV